MAEFRDRCRRHGRKITPQRVDIFRELIRSRNHPSAEILYRAIRKRRPNISFDTVNRTLQTFVSIGLTEIVAGIGGARRYDFKQKPHHHFLCRDCGRIFDFRDREFDEIEIPADLRDRFDVTSKRVVLGGICSSCRDRSQSGICE